VGLAFAAPTSFSEINGHPDTKWGGSVMAALQIKNIPSGAGDDFKIDASWAKGDTKQVISTSATSSWSRAKLHLRSELQRVAAWLDHPLDSHQGPGVLG
jgi:hypothetical protein